MFRRFFTILIITFIIVAIVAVCTGAVFIHPRMIFFEFLNGLNFTNSEALTDQQYQVLINIRLPRILLCILIGSGLSIVGATMQALFNNPMAEPGITGTSSGAALFTALFILFASGIEIPEQLKIYGLAIAGFIGACITSMLVYRLAIINKLLNKTTLLLSGIAINALAMSIVGLCIFLSTDAQLRSITFWSMGSLGVATWPVILIVSVLVIIPSVIIIKKYAVVLNIWSLGDTDSHYIGVNIQRSRRQLIILTSIITGVCVSFTGIIGFIGLVIPHCVRMMVGADHKIVLPASAIFGAIILIFADLIARTIAVPTEIPVGILTTLIGAPYFIYLLIKSNKISFA